MHPGRPQPVWLCGPVRTSLSVRPAGPVWKTYIRFSFPRVAGTSETSSTRSHTFSLVCSRHPADCVPSSASLLSHPIQAIWIPISLPCKGRWMSSVEIGRGGEVGWCEQSELRCAAAPGTCVHHLLNWSFQHQLLVSLVTFSLIWRPASGLVVRL